MAENRFLSCMSDGMLRNDPLPIHGLVLAPLAAMGHTAANGLFLGLSFGLVAFFTLLVSVFLPKRLTSHLRMLICGLAACLFYLPVLYFGRQWFPETVLQLEVFLLLFPANALITVRHNRYRHRRFTTVLTLFFQNIAFALVALVAGCLRELLGHGTLFGRTVPGPSTVQATLLPFFGMILLGFLAAILQAVRCRLDGKEG